ncbi:class I SAM-dependent methyltransferase [Actinomadura fibrosa]|uniref:Class I SAM-dependent methyltransferase n=1 Tax=Actinomadura fibrosa TaxID=111802 RepID=A0ABW2Y3J4_9ACTN|nr:class I SAM-dependent methyltransferase [Actinomadura fibrosa]
MRPAHFTPTGDHFHDASGDHAVAAALLWNPLGERYVELLRPAAGERVLDACCGAGASALPAARAVGPTGRVDAVDIAAGMVEAGRRRAKTEDLRQAHFHAADITAWSPAQPYDLILCGYGIFFLPDMDTSARHLISLTRPGGRFSVATWAEGALQDFGALLFQSAGAERSLPSGEPPVRRASRRIETERRLADWATSLDLTQVTVHRMEMRVPISPENAWGLVLGSGFRAILSGLDARATARVRNHFLDALRTERIDHLDASSLVLAGTA